MNKKIYLSIAIAFLTVLNLFSQRHIVVQNGSSISFYTKLDSAIVYSENGDSIYLPGGPFQITQAIDKELYIFGAGIHPNATEATNYTYISGSVIFNTGGSNSYITGVSISNHIGSTENVTGIIIERCLFNGLRIYSSCNSWVLRENIINGQLCSLDGPGASNLLFSNNVIPGFMGGFNYDAMPGFTNCIFKNNIFYSSGGCYYGCKSAIISPYSIIENNIFIGDNLYYEGYLLQADFSIINNNLFKINYSIPANCTGSGNIVNQPIESIFVTGPGTEFSFENNYQLQEGCPGNGAGTDGNDIGIYGGSIPWKDYSIPINPHIQSKNIPDTTNQNGNIQINVSVKAQNN